MLSRGYSKHRIWVYVAGAVVLVTLLAVLGWRPEAMAQDGEVHNQSGSPSSTADEDGTGGDEEDTAPQKRVPKGKGLNLFALLISGGWFMIPLLALSILVVTITVERFIALRRSRVLPPDLVTGLGRLGGPQGAFDPRQAYRLCQQFPSAASTVIRAMLLKVGRPHSEVEHAVAEASEREANRLYSVVKWLNLAAAVAPLLGLLGTVWGIIIAFHNLTLMDAGANKAVILANGIYTALVTTLCGLIVAIPAVIFAHIFEGRITSLFHEIDELLFNLLPQIERFEGRVRFGRQMAEGEPPAPPHDAPPVVEAEVAAERPTAATPK